MVGITVNEPTQIESGPAVVPPRLEVAEARRGVDEDFDALPSQISVRHLDFFYGKEQALFDNEIEIKQNRVTAVIGPSGCGKSTHIRTYNRIFNLYRDQKATGEIIMDGDEHPLLPDRPARAASQHRHDLPEAEPVPHDRVRQRRLRAAAALQAEPRRSSPTASRTRSSARPSGTRSSTS